MTIHPATARADTSASFGALAEQLRDGALRELIDIQVQASELAGRLADNPAATVEDLERLVRLSLAAMERFHRFTLELTAVLRELTDARRHPH
jgi:hypothetical protein